jgi:hypothetical protein
MCYKRIKSFCVAKPMQKLRWTERVGAEGSAAAYGIFSRDWALEATTENRWKAPGFPVVAVVTFEIAGARPMAFVSR